MGDIIKKPDHYCEGREYEPKDVIRDWGLNFNLGSAVKYISRAGRKGDKLEDLRKARQFLEFEIEAIKERDHQKIIDAYIDSLLAGFMKLEDVAEMYREEVFAALVQNVLDGTTDLVYNVPCDLHDPIIDRIIVKLENGDLDLFDIPFSLFNCSSEIRVRVNNLINKGRKYDDHLVENTVGEEDKMKHEPTAEVKKRFVDLNTGKDIRLKQEETDTFTFSFTVEED